MQRTMIPSLLFFLCTICLDAFAVPTLTTAPLPGEFARAGTPATCGVDEYPLCEEYFGYTCMTDSLCLAAFQVSCMEGLALLQGNGVCESFLDCELYEYDGGDCVGTSASPEATDTSTCGTDDYVLCEEFYGTQCFSDDLCLTYLSASCDAAFDALTGNGVCETYLDCEAFEYDGGDCTATATGEGCGDDASELCEEIAGYTCLSEDVCLLLFGSASCTDGLAVVVGDGNCDSYLNCDTFDFDGGDCATGEASPMDTAVTATSSVATSLAGRTDPAPSATTETIVSAATADDGGASTADGGETVGGGSGGGTDVTDTDDTSGDTSVESSMAQSTGSEDGTLTTGAGTDGPSSTVEVSSSSVSTSGRYVLILVGVDAFAEYCFWNLRSPSGELLFDDSQPFAEPFDSQSHVWFLEDGEWLFVREAVEYDGARAGAGVWAALFDRESGELLLTVEQYDFQGRSEEPFVVGSYPVVEPNDDTKSLTALVVRADEEPDQSEWSLVFGGVGGDIYDSYNPYLMFNTFDRVNEVVAMADYLAPGVWGVLRSDEEENGGVSALAVDIRTGRVLMQVDDFDYMASSISEFTVEERITCRTEYEDIGDSSEDAGGDDEDDEAPLVNQHIVAVVCVNHTLAGSFWGISDRSDDFYTDSFAFNNAGMCAAERVSLPAGDWVLQLEPYEALSWAAVFDIRGDVLLTLPPATGLRRYLFSVRENSNSNWPEDVSVTGVLLSAYDPSSTQGVWNLLNGEGQEYYENSKQLRKQISADAIGLSDGTWALYFHDKPNVGLTAVVIDIAFGEILVEDEGLDYVGTESMRTFDVMRSCSAYGSENSSASFRPCTGWLLLIAFVTWLWV
eukprot:Rmarinus@m.19595